MIKKDASRDEKLVNWNSIGKESLIRAFLAAAQTPDMTRLFLDDLLSKDEIEKCSRKLQAAQFILQGMPYKYVNQMTGLSSAIIAQISKKLVNKRGGYNKIINRISLNRV